MMLNNPISCVTYIAILIAVCTAFISCRSTTTAVPCNTAQLHSANLFRCDPYLELAEVETRPAQTYLSARQYFPQSWQQLGFNQMHSPVFPVAVNAPDFLKEGTFWAAPLTGLEYQRYRRAKSNIPDAGGQVWARIMATTLGAIMGVSVAQGIVFTQQSNNTLNALDAETGHLIWTRELVNVGGMGQVVVGDINGRPTLFVGTGDAGFTVQNVIDFTNNLPHDRGAGFSTLYAVDGLKGELIWQLNTKGASRVVPIYLDGFVYLATGGGKFHVIDATNGQIVGSFANPGGGFPGLSHLNWYRTPANRLYVIYGVLRPRNIMAVDVTDPTTPTLAWQMQPQGAAANSPGDTPVAVDPVRGLVVTTVFTDTGGAAQDVFDIRVLALDANTGVEVWNRLAGEGPSIPGFKASVPMIHGDSVYIGNSLNETYQAYNLDTGDRRWSTFLPGGVYDTSIEPRSVQRNRPSGAGVFYNGSILQSQGDFIRTFDAATGIIINEFYTPQHTSGTWAVVQPVIVGRQMYLSSLSGWVFALPVSHVMDKLGVRAPRVEGEDDVPKRQPEHESAVDRPDHTQISQFPNTWTAYAGGQSHNSVVSQGPAGVDWSYALQNNLALTGPARDEALYGAEIATLMTHWAYGVGTGVTPAKGMLYVGSDQFTINALNAITGDLVWRHRTANFNFSQPIVTTDRVIVSAGDPWMTLGLTGPFKQRSAEKANIGERLPVVTGLDPISGVEKWSVYPSTGTSAMTPLYWKGKILLVNGEGMVWSMDAVSGTLDGLYIDSFLRPNIVLGGFNATSSANIYYDTARDLMIVGTAMPNKISAIDLNARKVPWTQDFPGIATHITGFAAVSPAVSQADHLVIGSVITDVDYALDRATILAYALDARTGNIAWTTPIGTGPVPADMVGSTPVLDATHAYFNNPISNTTVSLVLSTGAIQWQAAAVAPAGRKSWGPGVVIGQKLIQPIGPYLYTFDKVTGTELNRLFVGGSFTFNHPSVAGKTLYIGNSWGHVHAFSLGTVTGDPVDNL